jgi:hypothetical protein
MDILRFVALDLGPYFGVFLVLVIVIWAQWKIMLEVLEIKHEVKNGSNHQDDDCKK